MKYFYIILLLLKINIIVSNTITFNVLIIDSFKIKKIEFLNKELTTVFNEFKYGNNFPLQGNIKYKNVIIIEEKKLKKDTNVYVITETKFIQDILENIPSYYIEFDSCLVCIYTGKENTNKLDYKCIKSFFKIAEKYCVDKYEVISWKKLIFKQKIINGTEDNTDSNLLQNYDPFILGIKMLKGRLVNKTLYPDQIYKPNMQDKVKIYLPDGTLYK